MNIQYYKGGVWYPPHVRAVLRNCALASHERARAGASESERARARARARASERERAKASDPTQHRDAIPRQTLFAYPESGKRIFSSTLSGLLRPSAVSRHIRNPCGHKQSGSLRPQIASQKGWRRWQAKLLSQPFVSLLMAHEAKCCANKNKPE